jgi:rubrerythrin
MLKLTDTERNALLGAAKRVHAYKLMQAKGYERLARKAQDERAKRLLMDVSAGEAEDAGHWAEGINALGEAREEIGTAFLADLRIRLMMGILGTRGFF